MQNIFIVDDDRIFQMLTKFRLEAIDMEKNIFSFENGQACLDYILENLQDSEKLPDVIFLDINMPILDGWEFMEAFSLLKLKHSTLKKTFIHMISSSINELEIQKATTLPNVSSYTIKPITQLRLLEVLSPFIYK